MLWGDFHQILVRGKSPVCKIQGVGEGVDNCPERISLETIVRVVIVKEDHSEVIIWGAEFRAVNFMGEFSWEVVARREMSSTKKKSSSKHSQR